MNECLGMMRTPEQTPGRSARRVCRESESEGVAPTPSTEPQSTGLVSVCPMMFCYLGVLIPDN